MDAAGLVVAEAGRIVDDRAEVELHRDITASLVDVGRVRVRAEQVKALRATKGKRLGRTTVELLEWIHDDLEDLARALDRTASMIRGSSDDAAGQAAGPGGVESG